jgi:hypothetical protein
MPLRFRCPKSDDFLAFSRSHPLHVRECKVRLSPQKTNYPRVTPWADPTDGSRLASIGREGDAPAEPEMQSSAGASHSLCTLDKSISNAFTDPIREDWTDPIAMQPTRKGTISRGPE